MTRDELERLFPAGVVAEVAIASDADEQALYPEERALMGEMSPARRVEFASGRNAARRVLARLGAKAGALLPEAGHRHIRWPAGITASISHTRGYCAVAGARITPTLRSVGLDVEQAGPLAADVIRAVCRADELEELGQVLPPPDSDWPRVLFVAKEAAYKAWYPLARRVLDFQEMKISVRGMAFTGDVDDYRGDLRVSGKVMTRPALLVAAAVAGD